MPAKLKKLIDANSAIDWMQLDVPEPPPFRSEGFSSEIVEEMPDDSSLWWPQEKVEKHLRMMSPAHLELVNYLKIVTKSAIEHFSVDAALLASVPKSGRMILPGA